MAGVGVVLILAGGVFSFFFFFRAITCGPRHLAFHVRFALLSFTSRSAGGKAGEGGKARFLSRDGIKHGGGRREKFRGRFLKITAGGRRRVQL